MTEYFDSEFKADVIKSKARERRRKKSLTPEQRKAKVKDWTTFYRRNWNIYAKHDLGIPLHFFQEVMLYLLGVSQIFYLMCSRGNSKSFIAALAATVKCMLYPESEVVLTATTIKTARKMVKNKIEDEICGKMSKKLSYLKDRGFIVFSYNQDDIRVDFTFNGSWILILPEVDSSRGKNIKNN